MSFIYRFVPAQNPGLPTLLLLHGTGGNENDLIPLGEALLPGASMLSPRGKVLENGMPRFFRRLAEGVFDVEDLIFRTHELADFVQEASHEHAFDLSNLIAVGFSNGANIAAGLLLLRPGVLSAAVLFRPMVPLVPETMPDLKDVPVLIAAGTSDPIVSSNETERLANLLSLTGAEVTLHWSPGGHGLTMEDVQAATQWFLQQGLER
jgi:predicted esterase